jgi:hypothetical protein
VASAIKAKKTYERLVKQLVGLRAKAAKARRKMISFNRHHPEELTAKRWSKAEKAKLRAVMPKAYRKVLERVQRSAQGRSALKAYELFWGIPYPPEIDIRKLGKDRSRATRVCLGISPAVFIAKKRGGKARKIPGKRRLAFDPRSRRMMVLNMKSKGPVGKNLSFLGYAPETHYIPTPAMERTGTFKTGKYWVHKHDDDGGKWPEVWVDSSGNFIYGQGTYKVDRWLRR